MTTSLILTVHSLNSDIRVGSYYYFEVIESFSRNVEVRVAPISPFHILKLNPLAFFRRLLCIGHHINGSYQSDVYECTPFSLIPFGPMKFFSSNFVFEHSYHLSFPKLKSNHYDIVYCDNPYLARSLDGIKFSTLVFRIPDYLPPEGQYPALDEAIGYLIKSASLVIVASRLVMRQVMNRYYVTPTYISNGVDISRFTSFKNKLTRLSSFKKSVCFVGTFDYWLDIEILEVLIKSLADINIILIGQVNSGLKNSLTSSNVHFTGALHPDDVVPYLQHADVGIIPFDVTNHKEFVDGINPLKAYEYLAAGIPVVSTDFAGVRGISPYITTASSPDEFCHAVENYLDNPPDRNAVRKTAEPYDWSVVLKPFEDFVKKSLGKSEKS